MPVITLPTPEEMAALELFEGLPLERIFVPLTVQEFGIAADKLCSHSVLGFDTETKPSFVRGLESRGPHIVQLATPHYAVIFQVFRDGCLPAVRRILESTNTAKVGFGLLTDLSSLRDHFGVYPKAVVDVGSVLTCTAYKGNIGTRAAVAAMLNRRFAKSKKTTTSNWAVGRLTDKQLLYAANDAYAALLVFEALEEQEQCDQLQLALER